MRGSVPPERDQASFSDAERQHWSSLKQEWPAGTPVEGIVVSVDVYGVYVDLGVPFRACLLAPYLAPPTQLALSDNPAPGDALSAFVRHYSDDLAPGQIGTIALTQVQGTDST